ATAGDPGAAAGWRTAGDRAGPGTEDRAAGGVQAPAGAPRGRPRARPQGRQAAPVRPRRERATAGPRVDRRVRAVLEREPRPVGPVRAGAAADKAGGIAHEPDRKARAGTVRYGRPRDRGVPGD